MRILLASVAMLSLAACGGGGSSSGPVAPPPITPPPAAPPPPPPPTPTARTFATGTGPAFYIFNSDETFAPNDPNFTGGYGTRDGFYFPSFRNAYRGAGFGILMGDLSNRAKIGQIIDAETGVYLQLRAPARATMVSPVTSLMLTSTDQAKLKRQLGIIGSLFGLQASDPDLLTYDAIAGLADTDASRRGDAARLLAANARVMGIAAATADIGFPAFFVPDLTAIGTALNAAPDRFLFNNADMTALLAGTPALSALRPDVQSAIAHLVNAYAAAIPIQINDADLGARYLMGIQGFLIPEIIKLRQANSAAAASAALAVSSPQIIAALQRYSERVPVTATGFFFPGPDHYTMATGATLRLTPPTMGQTGNYPTGNDFHANAPMGAIGYFTNSGTTITGITVPSANASQVSTTLDATGQITIVAAAGFAGLTYFDYAARHPEGETQTARVYIRVG